MYHGDIALEGTIDIKFTTRKFSTGAPFTLAGTPVISAYVDNSTTQITAGITLTADFDSVTGLNNVRVVAAAASGYAAGTNVALVITTGTVDSVSVVGEVVGSFSISHRPVQGLASGVVTAAAIATGAIDADAIADSAIDAGAIATGAITSAKFAAGAIDATAIADNAIDAAAIATGAITSAKFAAGAIDAAAIADAAIDAATFAAGAITASAIAADAIGASELAADAATEIADAVLSRNVSNVEATAAEHTLCTVILGTLEYAVSGTTWTIKRTDGTTTHATKTLSTDASAEHVTAVA